MEVQKTLVCMRGLPYSGKSYRANELLKQFREKNGTSDGVVFSTDEFFYLYVKPDKPEEYSFNPRFLEQAHKWNQLRAQRQIDIGHPLVIIDNTNTTAEEFCCGYARYAFHQDYKICIEEPTSDRWLEIRELLRNKKSNKAALKKWAAVLAEGSKETHNVPAYAIERMMWRWQPDLNPDQVVENCCQMHTYA